jgi:ABC-type nitrate/sulfonate/bicarbonate transport system permease component
MLLLLAMLWQTTAWVVDNQLLWPHLHLVLIKLVEMLGRVQFLEAVANSVWMTVVSFAMVSILMLVIVLATYPNKFARRLTINFCDMLGPTPTMSWLPVFLIFFGFSQSLIFTLMTWGVLWVFLPSVYSLVTISHDTWSRQIRDLRLTPWQAVIKVYVPSMLPGLVSLSKTYFMFLWRILFAVEIVFGTVGGHIGIGTLMYDFKGRFDHLEVYACLLMIMILGGIMSWSFSRLIPRR